MVSVPAGSFWMGGNAQFALKLCQKYRDPLISDEHVPCQLWMFTDEEPLHSVYLDAYYIDQFEVTNAMYATFLNYHGGEPQVDKWFVPQPEIYITEENGVFQPKEGYEDYPAVWVTWYEARLYCEWAGRRLPTEAEWEKAARGTDGRIYPWGNHFAGLRANFCDRNCTYEWANEAYTDRFEKLAPVGSYPAGASPYGVMDMAGNVKEWVDEEYDPGGDPYLSEPVDPRWPEKILRGGSWISAVNFLRVSDRFQDAPIWHYEFVGFRCVLDPDRRNINQLSE
jgi:serine/threonine-protein kinase